MECASAMGRSPPASIGATIWSIRAVKVRVILREVVDMAFERRLRHQAARAALAAPVQRRHGKAAAAQLVDHLEIFLDEFGLAVEKDAQSRARRRRVAGKARRPQAQARRHQRHRLKTVARRNHGPRAYGLSLPH